MSRCMPDRGRRGAVLVIVIWAVAIAAALAAGLQVVSFRQASMGNQVIARLQARWCARAGVETMIAIMEYHTENPDPEDALALINELQDNSYGELDTGIWDIRHTLARVEIAGPLDEHSKANINLLSQMQLMNIRGVGMDTAQAIVDWRDSNTEPGLLGAEASFYRGRGKSYGPRNKDFRSSAEVELVAGVMPESFRGEDWNLNGRLDANEDDGEFTWPEDNEDGVLDAGWSDLLTASSRTSPLALSGTPRLNLKAAETDTKVLMERVPMSEPQATALLAYARTPNARLEQLMVAPLSTLSGGQGQQGAQGGQGGTGAGRTGRSSGGAGRRGGSVQQQSPNNLDPVTVGNVLNECTLEEFTQPKAGKMNINTISEEVLRDVFDLNPRLASAIIQRRDAKSVGLTSLATIMDIPGMTPEVLSPLSRALDVQSFVFTISCKGRSFMGGAEHEMVVTVDRSTLPAQILMYREP